MIHISAETYVKDVANLAKQIDASRYKNIYGIPRGGVPVAIELAKHLGIPIADKPGKDTLIVDDLIDSGRTLQAYPNNDTAVIYRKPNSPHMETYCGREVDGWIVFFYDKQDYDLEDNVVRILQFLDENVSQDVLNNTPKQYLELLKNFLTPPELKLDLRKIPASPELFRPVTTDFSGVNVAMATPPPDKTVSSTPEASPGRSEVLRKPSIIKTTKTNSTVPVKYTNIPFISLCECHIMPIIGTVDVEFTPNGLTLSREEVETLVNFNARKMQAPVAFKTDLEDYLFTILGNITCKIFMDFRLTCDELK